MVTPIAQHPPGDISLSDGTNTVYLQLANTQGQPDSRAIRLMGMPRTSMQMSTGDPDYGSFVLPYINIVQKDFSGGRGLEDFTKDTTRYYDSYNVDARAEDIILGPKSTASTGIRDYYERTGSTAAAGLTMDTPVMSNITPTANIFVRGIETTLIATSSYEFRVEVFTGVSTFVGGGYVYVTASASPQVVNFPVSLSLTGGTEYRVKFTIIGTMYYGAHTGSTVQKYNESWGTLAANSSLAYQLTALSYGGTITFEYKRSLFVVTKPADDSAPRLYINGYHGMAGSNSTNKSNLVTSLGLTANALVGKIAFIVAGPGSTEPEPWRIIKSNTGTGSNDTITVEPPWAITHTTSTEYAILGRDTWTQITGHGLTKMVTDVLVVDDVIYFCQGDATNIRRGRLKSDATWDTWADDGTNKATFAELIPDTTGKRKVWLVQATTASAYSSDTKAWGNNLVFGTAIVCGNPRFRVTKLIAYGQPRIPYIIKEDSFGSINGGVYAEVPLSEMNYVRSETNGAAACQWGVYLFFSMLKGLERYYDNRLDDMGPNRDEGMPAGRSGIISFLLPYPGGIIAAMDGGADGYSCILYWNQLGWHEIYRAPIRRRISNLFIQVMPGDTVDRLWFNEDEDFSWLPITLNPRNQTGYTYDASTSTTDGSYIITSWYKTQFAEVVKFFKSLTLFTENLSANVSISAFYQTDTATDADAWTALPTAYTTSPIQEVDLSSTHSVTGKRIRFKLYLISNSTSVSPRIKALTLNTVCRVPQKSSYSITFFAESAMRDMNGMPQTMTLATLISTLAGWADSNTRAAPLVMRSILPEVDETAGQYVFIDPPNINPVYIDQSDGRRILKYVASMSIYEA